MIQSLQAQLQRLERHFCNPAGAEERRDARRVQPLGAMQSAPHQVVCQLAAVQTIDDADLELDSKRSLPRVIMHRGASPEGPRTASQSMEGSVHYQTVGTDVLSVSQPVHL